MGGHCGSVLLLAWSQAYFCDSEDPAIGLHVRLFSIARFTGVRRTFVAPVETFGACRIGLQNGVRFGNLRLAPRGVLIERQTHTICPRFVSRSNPSAATGGHTSLHVEFGDSVHISTWKPCWSRSRPFLWFPAHPAKASAAAGTLVLPGGLSKQCGG